MVPVVVGEVLPCIMVQADTMEEDILLHVAVVIMEVVAITAVLAAAGHVFRVPTCCGAFVAMNGAVGIVKMSMPAAMLQERRLLASIKEVKWRKKRYERETRQRDVPKRRPLRCANDELKVDISMRCMTPSRLGR